MNTELLIKQITSLAWIRAAIESGVDFVNKETAESELDEVKIYTNFENKTGLFDVPNANVSPKIFEKNVLEVIGSYVLNSKNPELLRTLLTSEFRRGIIEKINIAKSKS